MATHQPHLLLLLLVFVIGINRVTPFLLPDSSEPDSIGHVGRNGAIIHADIHERAEFEWTFEFTEEYEYMEVMKTEEKGKPVKRMAFKLRGSKWTPYQPYERRVKIIQETEKKLKFHLLDTNEEDEGTYQSVITLRSGKQLVHTQQLVVKIVGPCAEGVCKNSGTCHSPSKGTYTCTCTKGFAGKNCTVRYQALGCFEENAKDRALPLLLVNIRSSIDWSNMDKTVKGCSEYASQHGYNVFGVQFFGECWSGHHAGTSYNKHGPSKSCWQGVGKANTNFVYMNEST